MNTHLLPLHEPEALRMLEGTADCPVLLPETFVLDAPDVHLALIENNKLAARCSLWWQHVPDVPGQTVGLVGHYAAATSESAATLLQHALATLAANGCTLALGPMDGATWRPYRFVTGGTSHPPFFLEPTNPSAYPQHFVEAGFAPYARYHSSATPLTDFSLPRTPPGLRLRPLDVQQIESELAALYALTCLAFANNLLYTPPPRAAFLAQYRALLPFARPDLVLIAEHAGTPVAYLLLLPDVLQARRGEAVDTILFKTVAVHPDWQGRGIGTWLMAAGHALARQQGFTKAIHALFYESNPSARISATYGKPMRHYALFGREL